MVSEGNSLQQFATSATIAPAKPRQFRKPHASQNKKSCTCRDKSHSKPDGTSPNSAIAMKNVPSQRTVPATTLALCHHVAQHCHCDSQSPRNRLKCSAWHDIWTWTPPKCRVCHEHFTFYILLRRPSQKAICNTVSNTSECHKVPCLPYKTALHP